MRREKYLNLVPLQTQLSFGLHFKGTDTCMNFQEKTNICTALLMYSLTVIRNYSLSELISSANKTQSIHRRQI